MVYGYVRVSTEKQENGNSITEQKLHILERYPNAQITEEVYSGAKERPKFLSMIENAKKGDTIVVTKLDRFCRSTQSGLEYIAKLRDKGVAIHILNMGLIENSAMGTLIVTSLLAFAEFERAMILERTQAGKEIAKQRENFKDGRPKKVVQNVEKYRDMVEQGIMSVKKACLLLGVSKSWWYYNSKV